MFLNDFFDDKYFNTIINGTSSKLRTQTDTYCNIYQEDNSYVFDLYLPGMTRDDFNIGIDNNILFVSGTNSDTTKRVYVYQEYKPTTKFERSFSLPKNINIEGIDASYNSGVLTITIPKIEERKPQAKKITIK